MLRKVAVIGVVVGLALLIGVVGVLRMSALGLVVGSGPIALVQAGAVTTTQGTATDPAAPVATLTSPSTAGTALVFVAGGISGAIVSMPTGFLNVLTVAGPNSRYEVWIYPNNPGGIQAVRGVDNGSNAGSWAATLSEWSNVAFASVLEASGTATSAGGSTLAVASSTGVLSGNDVALAGWNQRLAGAGAVTFTSPAGFTRAIDNGSDATTSHHVDLEYQLSPPLGILNATLSSTGTTNPAAAGGIVILKSAMPRTDVTGFLAYDSIAIKNNTADFGLMNGGKYLLEDGSGFYLLEDSSGDYLLDTYVPQLGDPVTVTNPTWTGRVVSVQQSDLEDLITNYQRVTVAATNNTPAPGGTAPGDLSDTAVGGYYVLEDASGDYLLEDGSGRYVLEGTAFVYRNLNLQKSQNQDGTVTTYGSLETFEGGFAAGMTFNLTSTNFGITAQPYTITNVNTSFLHTTPLYLIEFGDAYQTLQTAGGGVLTQVGSQAVIQQGSAVPAGRLGGASVSTNQGSITTVVDLTGLSVTVTEVAGRRIRISGSASFQSTVLDDAVLLTLVRGSTTIQSALAALSGANLQDTIPIAVELTSTGGVQTYKLQAQRAAGSGTLTMIAGDGSTNPLAFITVEDVGI